MRSRPLAGVLVLLSLSFLFIASLRMGTHLFNFQAFHVESKLIYVIVASATFGALLMFFLFSIFPDRSRRSDPAVFSGDPSSALQQAATAVQLREYDEAEALLSGISRSGPESWHEKKIAGDLALQKGDWTQAETLFREAFHVAPQQPAVLFALANLYESQGMTARAQDFYRHVLQFAPDSLETVLRLRMLAVSDQKWQDAFHWQEYLERHLPSRLSDPEERMSGVGIRFEFAESEFRNGAYRTAQALLKYILRMDHSFVPGHLLAGEILTRLENPSAALRAWERGFEQTKAPVLLQRIGEHFLRQGRPEKAIDFLRGAAARNPEDPLLEFCLADLYIRMEMLPESIRMLEHILSASSDWHLGRIRLASLYRRTGQPERAADLLQGTINTGELISGFPWQCYNCSTTYPEYRSCCLECLSWNAISLYQNQAVHMDSMNEKSTAYPV